MYISEKLVKINNGHKFNNFEMEKLYFKWPPVIYFE